MFNFFRPKPSNSALESYDDRDFLLGGDLKITKAENTYWDFMLSYHQPDVHKNSCTVHAAMGAYSDLTGYLFNLQERKDIWAKAITLGADPSVGWYLNRATKLIADEMGNVNYFRVSIPSEKFFEALNKGYTVVCGYRGNRLYNLDRNDGILDKVDFGEYTYGHACRITKKGDDFVLVIDNYRKSMFTNTYKINKENLDALVRNRVFFWNGYIYMRDLSQEDIINAKIKGLQVAKKIKINQSEYQINKIEKELAELEDREPKHYFITPET